MESRVREMVGAGRLDEAETILVSLLSTNGGDVEASTLLGILFARTNRLEEASQRLERALQIDPGNSEARTWLASVRSLQNRFEEAVSLLKEMLPEAQKDPEIVNLYGVCLLRLGRASDAAEAFRKVIELQTGSAAAYANLGMALRLQNRGIEALEAFKTAVSLDPEKPQNFLQLFKQHQQLSQWVDAIDALQNGLKRHPGSLELAEALALTYGRLRHREEAEQTFQSIFQKSARVANSYATWLQEEGRFADSIPVLTHSLNLQPSQGSPYRSLVEAGQEEINGKPILDTALELFNEPRLDDASRMHLAYALGRLYDRQQNPREATIWFDKANSIAYSIYPVCKAFNPEWTAREPAQVSQVFSRENLNALSPAGSDDTRPIFIVGMIRSGTTLLDQIVSAHPDVVSAGEGPFWTSEGDAVNARWAKEGPNPRDLGSLASRYLATVDAPRTSTRFTDKMPLNFRHLGLIHAALPNAKILHIRRDPFDACLSIYMTFFAGGPNFAYNRANIVTFYRAYEAYMEHWRQVLPADRFFELRYESLVAHPEPAIREVVAFLDLTWDDACLRPDENFEAVSTPSRWQARQPIHTRSVGKGQTYGPFVGSFSDLLK